MPIVGVICPMDHTPQDFKTCIDAHENRSTTRNCHAPVFALKAMRDNHIHRRGAGISASTIISCARATAIVESYDIYERVISGYNKGRGSWTHAMIAADPDPPPWIIREQRLIMDIDGQSITGQPDEIDTKYLVLVDYKSKDNVPLRPDNNHEFQFNIYAHLLRHGYWAKDDPQYNVVKGEYPQIHVQTIAAHYLTWKTKEEKAWLKMSYPVWDDDYVDSLIRPRVATLVQWRETGVLPSCNAYEKSPYWKCDCEKFEQQLEERGVFL